MALVFCDGFDHYSKINYDPSLEYEAENQLWRKWEEGWDQGNPRVSSEAKWLRRPAPSSQPIGFFSTLPH
jgi:hypothetical protein